MQASYSGQKQITQKINYSPGCDQYLFLIIADTRCLGPVNHLVVTKLPQWKSFLDYILMDAV